jgi:hypothetical protein
MQLTKKLAKSEIETIALEAYNNAIDDMVMAGLIESRKEAMTNDELKKLKEETIQFVAKNSMTRYESKGE